MKRWVSAVAILAIISTNAVTPAWATAVDGNPTAFISSLGKAVLNILENPGLSQQERVQQYSAHFKSAFDWNRISAFAIGQYQSGVPQDKFAEYRDLFSQHMTRIYAAKFADYSGEQFVVKGERQLGSDASEVSASITGNNDREPTNLLFRVVRDGDRLKIYDVAINGVSLLVAKRAEVKGIMSRGGIDGLIAALRKIAAD